MPTIPRSTFLSALTLVEEAIARKDFVEVLTCFCFDGKTITAYDDIVILQAPCAAPIKGAVKASVLSSFVRVAKAKEYEVSQSEAELSVKAGRSKLKLALLPETDFLHEFPSDEKKAAFTTIEGKGLIDAFLRAAITIGTDPSQPELLGITLKFSDGRLTLYSTDNLTATRVKVKAKGDADVKVQMSPRFCELITKVGLPMEKLLIGEGWVEARFNDGVRLFGKACGDGALGSYSSLFKTVSESKLSTEVPAGLERALERALVVWQQSSKQEDCFDTKFVVSENRLRLTTETGLGRVDDSMKFEHPDVEVLLVPGTVKKCLSGASGMTITSEFVVVGSDEFLHVISPGE